MRKTTILSDNWRFQIDRKNLGEDEGWFNNSFNRDNWARVMVPQAWDYYETALWGYEGIGWYSATINPEDFDSEKRMILGFGRVMFHSKVWVNENFVGKNIGGYLPFSFDVTHFLEPRKKNTVVVRVDNTPRLEWLPGGKQIEWIQYGSLLEKAIDELTDRIGIRTISTEGSSILLNGKPLKIKGVNRYDEYGRMGPTVPEDTLRSELELIKNIC
ncbi:MAG: sugar-binding domain-containing protein [Mariniphaga sp.]|nr:glycoside hydrolase family 2 TIM barrel-domain containing protein [Mariniphaga sp.]MDD4425778.1 glycoside hydrolase family 2 TIM barrel-domain containing protein [Mariniphaga sp.]